MNYLRGFDEAGAALTTIYRNELGDQYDMRRVFATVVIGHPHHARDADEVTIQQTIRSYNAHLSRIEVITYKELADAAERSLAFDEYVIGDRSLIVEPATEPQPWDEHLDHAKVNDPWDDEPPF